MTSAALNATYLAYRNHPNEDTITDLFTACRQYGSQIARSYDRGNAEDVAQEAVIKVWSSLDSYRGESSFAEWFRAITHNIIRDLHRRATAQCRPTLMYTEPCSLPDMSDTSYLDVPVDSGDLPGLSDAQRHTVDTLILHDWSLEGAADALHITPKTLRNRITAIKHVSHGTIPERAAS